MDRFRVDSDDKAYMEPDDEGDWVFYDDVQSAIDAAVAAERERCAKVCEDSDVFEYDDPGGFFARLIRSSAAATSPAR